MNNGRQSNKVNFMYLIKYYIFDLYMYTHTYMCTSLWDCISSKKSQVFRVKNPSKSDGCLFVLCQNDLELGEMPADLKKMMISMGGNVGGRGGFGGAGGGMGGGGRRNPFSQGGGGGGYGGDGLF